MAFASYVHLLSTSLVCLEEAALYGQVALQILDRFQTKEWTARVYGLVHSSVTSVIWPLEDALALLWQGHRTGLVTGDYEVRISRGLAYVVFRLTEF